MPLSDGSKSKCTSQQEGLRNTLITPTCFAAASTSYLGHSFPRARPSPMPLGPQHSAFKAFKAAVCQASILPKTAQMLLCATPLPTPCGPQHSALKASKLPKTAPKASRQLPQAAWATAFSVPRFCQSYSGHSALMAFSGVGGTPALAHSISILLCLELGMIPVQPKNTIQFCINITTNQQALRPLPK